MRTPFLTSTLRAGIASLSCAAALLGAAGSAHASGPVERLVQVFTTPGNPDTIVVRYGFALNSDGFLFSRDGGKTFSAMCSDAINPKAPENDRPRRIGLSRIPSTAPVTLDDKGRLLVSTINGVYSDDATACTWAAQPDLAGSWAYSIKRDPKNPGELWASVNVTKAPDGSDAHVELMHRDAAGKWTSAGSIAPKGQVAYAGDLLVAPTPTGTRFYALVMVSTSVSAPETAVVFSSDDAGKTWKKGSTVSDTLELLAVDPTNPDRVVGATHKEDAIDAVLLSDDQGKTFKKYVDVRDVTGVVIEADGRVYIGDAGDSTGGADTMGGLFSAASLSAKPTKVADTEGIDCIGFDDKTKYLHVCKRDRFGLMDGKTGAFQQLTRFENIDALVKCPNVDMVKTCEPQLNMGASLCCGGHYPFTPFCAGYDVRTVAGKSVSCGVAGRELDLASGRGPSPNDPGVMLPVGGPMSMPDGGVVGDLPDAGTSKPDAGKADAGKADAGKADAGKADAGTRLDAGTSDDEDDTSDADDATGEVGDDDDDDDKPRQSGGGRSDGGCSLAPTSNTGSPGGLLVSLGMLLVVLGRSLRRRDKR